VTAMRRKYLAVILCMGLAAGAALADDMNPPIWRGGPLSTSAQWEFSSMPTLPGDGTAVFSPDGAEVPLVVGDGGSGGGSGPVAIADNMVMINDWLVCAGLQDPPTILLDIPNWIDEIPEKLIRIQITGDNWGEPLSILLQDAYDPTGPVDSRMEDPVYWEDAGGIEHMYVDMVLWPNPDWEMLLIDLPFGAAVDQIIVDTISPEPGTLALLAIGGVLALARRRRR